MMTSVAALSFDGVHEQCRWVGVSLDLDDLDAIRDRLRERAHDLARGAAVADLLLDLASTGMAGQFITEFLEAAEDPNVEDWQVGEALAEALLEDEHDVTFPWNTRRDERTTHASLPGADLVGLSGGPVMGEAILVFGEVKSSSDQNAPPHVVYGKSGLVEQLERLAVDRKIQWKLIKWLEARVPQPEAARFEEALANFVNTQGAAMRLIGCLIRDTAPAEADVVQRGRDLGELVQHPGRAELLVWYLPLPMIDWPTLV